MVQLGRDLRILLDGKHAVRISVGGYMPLNIEQIGHDRDGHALIAMSHTSIQNGDLMRDPEMVFVLHQQAEGVMAEPIEFRNDYMGVRQEVYEYDTNGHRTHIRPRLKKELLAFSRTWFTNLRDQGFFGPHAKREALKG